MSDLRELIYAVRQFEWDVIHLIALAALLCIAVLFLHDTWCELRRAVRHWRVCRRPVTHIQERRHVEAAGYSDPAFRPAPGGRAVAPRGVARGPLARRVDGRPTGDARPRPVDAPVRLHADVRGEAAARPGDVATLPRRVHRHPQGAA